MLSNESHNGELCAFKCNTQWGAVCFQMKHTMGSCVLSNETHNEDLCAFKRNELCHYVAIFALDLNIGVCNTLMQFGNSVALNSVYIR